MKNLKYIFCFFASSLFATRTEEARGLIKLTDFLLQRQIEQDLNNLSSENVVEYIGQDWLKMVFWGNSHCQLGKSMLHWIRCCPQAYWQLILGFDYLGQFQCFWNFIFQREEYAELFENLFTKVNQDQLKDFVYKYFIQIKQDMAHDQSLGNRLQQKQWGTPFEILLRYRPEVFLWLMEQEPKYRIAWLNEGYNPFLLKWLTLSPETLYFWISNNLQAFKDVITHSTYTHTHISFGVTMAYKPLFWKFLALADLGWLAKHLNLIVEMINQDLKLIAYGGALSDFIKQRPHFFVRLLLEDTNLLNHLFENDNSTYSSVLRVILQQNLKLYVQLRQVYRRVKQKNISAKQAWQEINHEHLTKKPKRRSRGVSQIIFDCSLPELEVPKSSGYFYVGSSMPSR